MSTYADDPSSPSIMERVEQVISAWKRGTMQVDAATWLKAHPDVQHDEEAVLRLAYEEYFRCTHRGDSVDPVSFCARFPTAQAALARLLDVDACVERDQEEEARSFPRPGTEYLGFRIVSELGRGSVARVYLAREEALGERWVVLKISRSGDSEAVALGRLDHPGIVQIHSAFEDIDQRFITLCMPFESSVTLRALLNHLDHDAAPVLSGAELASVVRELDLPIEDDAPHTGNSHPWRDFSYHQTVCHIGYQIASALAYAHSLGIAHLDIKPANILVTRQGRVKLLDFNLAHDSTCRAELRGGTPRYMPPEQYDSLALGADEFDPHRADLYSLGAVLYELTTGEPPYRPASSDSVVGSRSGGSSAFAASRVYDPGSYVPVRHRNRRVPRSLAQVIDRCLSLDPKDRPASAEEVAHALDVAIQPRIQRLVAPFRARATNILRGVTCAAVFLLIGLSELPQESNNPLQLSLVSDDAAPSTAQLPPFPRAIHAVRTGRAKDAWNILMHQSAGIPKDAYFRSWYGYIAWRNGRVDVAYGASDTASQLAPDNYRLYYNTAIAHWANGDKCFAFRSLETAINKSKHDVRPRLLRLWMWRQAPTLVSTRVVRKDLAAVLPRLESWELHEIAAYAEAQSQRPNLTRLRKSLENARRLNAPQDILEAYEPLLDGSRIRIQIPAPTHGGLKHRVYDFLEPQMGFALRGAF